MKFDREELLAALKRVEPALDSMSAITALRHLWFDGKYVYAYSGALGIRERLGADLRCGVIGAALIGLLSSFTSKEVTISISKNQTGLDISAGRAKALLPIFPIEDNPWPFAEHKPKFKFELRDTLLEGMRRAQLIKVVKPLRLEHYGVAVFPKGSGVNLYTTDSRAMVEIHANDAVPKGVEPMILPHPFVSRLIAYEMSGAKVSISNDAVVAESGDTQVCCNLIDSAGLQNLPEVVSRFAKKAGDMLELPDIGGPLARAAVLAGSGDAFVTFAVADKQILLDGEFDYGVLHEHLPLKLPDSGRMAKYRGAGSIEIALDHLATLAPEAKHFAITEDALVMLGEGESTFLIAAHDSYKAKQA